MHPDMLPQFIFCFGGMCLGGLYAVFLDRMFLYTYRVPGEAKLSWRREGFFSSLSYIVLWRASSHGTSVYLCLGWLFARSA